VAELSGIIAFWRIFIYTNQLKGLSREDEIYLKRWSAVLPSK
jgi:hypothetical protein